TGTKGTEYFDVLAIGGDEVLIRLYNKTKEGEKKAYPFYSRLFKSKETKEVRLFGLDGKDIYTIQGDATAKIKLRIVGGEEKDSVLARNTNLKTYIYDNDENYIERGNKTRLKLKNDTAIHSYVFRSFLYDKKGISPIFFYSDEDRFYVGLGYAWEHHKWRKLPYAFKQSIGVNYSISQRAFSVGYKGLFPEAIGKLDLSLIANYDFVRWTNFYGLGNETLLTSDDKDYNRMRTTTALGKIGLHKKLANHAFSLDGFFESVQILDDDERYVNKIVSPLDASVFDRNNFAGAMLGYRFAYLNDKAVPTSGISFKGYASYTRNVERASQSFWKYSGDLQLYIPLISKFSLAISSGASTVTGNPLFYQYPSIGGGMDLRGFQRQRFYGKSAFYNSNELRFITNLKSYLLNGKIGFLAFVDDGRVWIPQEKSNTWHVGYGGGLLLAPFNKVLFDVTYGMSDEDKVIQLRLNLNL
ncbi:MAG: BamA/TamA family outer membrane protein, partial [Ginsengibacter sp.]